MRNLGFCICVTFWALCAGEDKRGIPSGFSVLPEKKPDTDDVPNEYIDKKTRYGLAELADERPYNNWSPVDPFGLYKRLPSGFFGLRGKKDLNVRENDFLDDFEDSLEKRPASSSFWGMRGKREYDTIFDMKRAPESRFFGMRGKRQPNKNSFFGMRGKKNDARGKRYDVRGKFVGVRGKKSLEPLSSEYFDDDEMSLDQLMYLLSQNERN